MLTDRDRGTARDIAYPDCVIAVLPDGQPGLGTEEISALRVLADAGLIPSLRPATTTPALTTPASPVTRRTGSRGPTSRPATARPSLRKTSPHPQLKTHSPRPPMRKDRQDRAESRRIG
jgi:hypothetical protein